MSIDNIRPSAMKPSIRKDPLLGSSVQAAPLKAARTDEALAMTEDVLAPVPALPGSSSVDGDQIAVGSASHFHVKSYNYTDARAQAILAQDWLKAVSVQGRLGQLFAVNPLPARAASCARAVSHTSGVVWPFALYFILPYLTKPHTLSYNTISRLVLNSLCA